MNRHLSEIAMRESIRGEPARYNQGHRGLNPMARHLAELKHERQQNREEKKYRLLHLRLPGLASREIRLPRWALLGKLSA